MKLHVPNTSTRERLVSSPHSGDACSVLIGASQGRAPTTDHWKLQGRWEFPGGPLSPSLRGTLGFFWFPPGNVEPSPSGLQARSGCLIQLTWILMGRWSLGTKAALNNNQL